MSPKEILAIAIKVLSLWLLCELFLHLPSIFLMLDMTNQGQFSEITIFIYIAFCLPFLVAGFIISKLLLSISNSILQKLPSENKIFIPEADHKFMLQICGLFFVVSGLTALPPSLTLLFHPENTDMPWHFYLEPMQNLFQITIGTWLTLHSSWWSLFLGKVRGRV